MGEVKNLAIENEALQDRVEFLQGIVKQQQEYIDEIEDENTSLIKNIDRKRMLINRLKINNQNLTNERNQVVDELNRIKSMGVFEFAENYCTPDQQVEAGHQLARQLLGR